MMKARVVLVIGVLCLIGAVIGWTASSRSTDQTADTRPDGVTHHSTTAVPTAFSTPLAQAPSETPTTASTETAIALSKAAPTELVTATSIITIATVAETPSTTASNTATPPLATLAPATIQATPPPPPPPPPPSNTGQRLIIPAINIDAPIVLVGIDPNTGSMAAPVGWFDIGWYRYGPRPGYPGSAALAGHLDTNTGGAATFWNLDQLSPGDTIIYQAGNGSQLTFVVEETAFYPWDQVPLDRVFARSGEPRVSLITCGGQWSRDNRNYSHRTIVFARLQP